MRTGSLLLQSSKISWIRIYHLSRDLINPEGFKKFQYREGWAEDWFNPFFDIPKLISLAYLIYDIYIFPDLKGFRI